MSKEQQLPPSAQGPGARLARGAAIGRYVVLDLVGRGGMGDVYAAYDPELDRRVAVKLLRTRSAGGDGSEARGRLLREAQAIAKLSHPNVVVIFDVGTFEDDVFLAMEFLEGDTIARWRKTGQRGWKEVVRVFLAAGRGLAAAHGAGLVHRDFKPDNVMVGRDGKVRVMDFGLARQTTTEIGTLPTSANANPNANPNADSLARATPSDPSRRLAPGAAARGAPGLTDLEVTLIVSPPSGARISPVAGSVAIGESTMRTPTAVRAFEANLTQSGAMLGTPAYMAPEQFASKPGDQRSDQFSFCIALYEALYGVRPFEGKNLTALVHNVTAGLVREARAGSGVPPWIRRILLRGLSAAPEDRYPSMDQLLAWLERDPTVARRRWMMRAGAALLAIGVTVVVARGLQQRRLPCQGGGAKLAGIWEPAGRASPRKEAIRAAFAASGKSYAARAFDNASHILDRYVTSWTAVYADACQATAVRGEQSAEVLDLRMSCLAGRLESVRALTDVFLQADGQVVEKAISAAEALAPLERCSDLAVLRAVVKSPEDPQVRARVQQLRRRLAGVKALGDAGRLSDAVAQARPLVVEARALGYLPLTAEVLVRLGWVTMNRPAEADAILSEGAWSASASGDDELFAEAAVAQVLNVGFQEGRPEEARPWIRIADATLHRIGGHDLLRAWLVNNQGAVLFAQGRNEEALEMFRQAMVLKEKVLGPNAPDVAATLGNMGDPLANLGRFEEALVINQRALRIMEASDDQSDLPMYLSSRGEYLNALGRFVEAETQARRAIAIWERNTGTENAYMGFGLTVVGRSYLGRDRPREAVPLLTLAYDLRLRLDPGPSRVGETAFALAQALWRSGRDRPQALKVAAEAERQYARTPDARKLAEVRAWLGSHRAAMGVIAW